MTQNSAAQLPALRGGTELQARQSAALELLAPWLPSVQSASDQIPADKAALVPLAMAEVDRLMTPATAEQIALEVDKLGRWAAAFNIPAQDFETATEFYIEGLRTMPADLLALALERVRAVHKWGMRLPLPAEILSQVDHEIQRRLALKIQLVRASMCPVAPLPAKLTEAERAERAAYIAKRIAKLRAGLSGTNADPTDLTT